MIISQTRAEDKDIWAYSNIGLASGQQLCRLLARSLLRVTAAGQVCVWWS